MISLDPNSAGHGRRRRARWALSRPARAALILILVLATAALTWGGVRLAQNWLDRTQTIHFVVARDGPDRQFAEKLAQVMAGAHEFIRIAVTSSDDPLDAFSRREADLVVARSDAKLPGWSRAVAKLEKEIVLLAARGRQSDDALATESLFFHRSRAVARRSGAPSRHSVRL
ncbi:hypothetical protein [Rhodoblastus sp.]|uniref:hypothetical protein n=1 Tax=Rhodoblastus sp. TaxID=1962975 RepID=UPI0035AFDBAD